MLRAALVYPLRGDHTESVYLNGLVLSFATALAASLPGVLGVAALLPATPLAGYLGAVYRDGVADGSAPPAFGPLWEAARSGVAVLAVAAAFLLPAAVVIAVTAVGASGAADPGGSLSFLGSVRLFAGSTAVLVVILVALYLLPVGVGAALEAGSARAGLSPAALAGTATTGAYFTAYWVAVVLLGAAVGTAAALATLGRPGAAVGVALTFHALVGATHLLGRGYGAQGSLYDLL